MTLPMKSRFISKGYSMLPSQPIWVRVLLSYVLPKHDNFILSIDHIYDVVIVRQGWSFVYSGTLLPLLQLGSKEKVCFLSLISSFLITSFYTYLVCFCSGVTIWLLALIYFIAGVPGGYVLWYRPLYRAFRFGVFYFQSSSYF